ncbi:ABC transporter permease [Rhizobium rosettiformans]|uniref:ABC transporter permease n=1 Tax=Rhizobium rosettiformans TaxID=1368430 RepID=UPI00285525BB|nr:iron ABC transporter permease [Rhizobium rosettiformans]MDR7031051.1 iron(III) transport system permease protein [Rhizobium rosettiformans]MDR7066955.1 iron(III) transport system permease protein [Rhizobium rosettiformans]
MAMMTPTNEAMGLPGRLVRRFETKWFVIGGATLVVAWLTLIPLGFLFWQSFHTSGTMQEPAVLTMENYITAFESAESLVLMGNSLQFAFFTAAFALVVGTFFAWVNERTNTPFKSLFFAMSIIPLIIPGILFTVSWIMLASPQIGILNTIFGRWFNIYSMAGMVWVDGLHYAPIAFLLVTAAFRSMDPSLEESAMMSGASVVQTAFKVTLKLAWPAILAAFIILFIRAIESFEVPALLGLPIGLRVFTSAIYDAVHSYPSNIGLASAYAIVLLLITSVGIYYQSRLSNQGSKYSTVTGKGFRPRVADIGRWRYLTGGIFILYVVLVVGLPFLVLLWASLQRYYSVPSWNAVQNLSFDAYAKVLAYPGFYTAVWNSIKLAIGGATIVMLLTSIICWITIRTKIQGRWLLDVLASLPLVFPGIVLGLSLMVFYLNFDIGIYATLWIMLMAYVIKFLPYGMRYNATSMVQIHKELEESAAMSGASWLMTFRKVVLPLMKPGLMAGWIYIIVVSVRELSSSILLYSPGNEVISIMIWEFWQNGQYVELSAFGVMMITALFCFIMIVQAVSKRFGVKGM